MGLPTPQKTWIISPCNRVTYVSLADTVGHIMYGISQFLLSNGYTCVGSSDGTVGAMDGTSRWTNAAAASTRGNGGSASMSWMVLLDGNGAQSMLAYDGSSDDIFRWSASPGAQYVVAGTPTFLPMASDELLTNTGISWIVNAATTDRLWTGWVSSDAKCCRFAVATNGSWVGNVFGTETFTPKISGATSLVNNAWCFTFGQQQNQFINGGTLGHLASVVASTEYNAAVLGGCEAFGSVVNLVTVKTPLQGGSGYPMIPISIASTSANTQGKVADLLDWWFSNYQLAQGTTSPGLEFIIVCDGLMIPWDSTTTPQMI